MFKFLVLVHDRSLFNFLLRNSNWICVIFLINCPFLSWKPFILSIFIHETEYTAKLWPDFKLDKFEVGLSKNFIIFFLICFVKASKDKSLIVTYGYLFHVIISLLMCNALAVPGLCGLLPLWENTRGLGLGLDPCLGQGRDHCPEVVEGLLFSSGL